MDFGRKQTLARKRRFRICLDPGHTSEVGEGTRGQKLTELNAAWEMALAMRSRLEAQGVVVVLTKSDRSQRVKNKDRAALANRAGADLMLRLHCDAAAGNGIAVYAPTQQGRKDGKTGPSPQIIAASWKAARTFHRELIASLKGRLKDRGIKSDLATSIGSQQGALTGSIYSEVPILLVEMVILTNPADEKWLLDPKNFAFLADALTRAAVAALNVLP